MNNTVLKEIKNKLLSGQKNIVGIHGPQGVGKTTLNKFLKMNLEKEGYKVICISLDDFYLPLNKMKIFLSNSNDKLYKFRGLAGTHDLNLLENTLNNLINGRKILMPIFDKSISNGFGDRIGYEEIYDNFDIIILEGWMLGYKPILDNNDIEINFFNNNLKQYKNVQDMINIWVIIETDNLDNIIDWRYSAEPKNGMTLSVFKEFMKPYFTIYKKYKLNMNKIIVNKDREVIN